MHLENSNTTSYITIGHNRLAYTTYGSGNNIMIAIHGFGQSKAHWSFLNNHWSDTMIIAIDLPQHKDSKWKDATLTLDHLQTFITTLQLRYHFQHFSLIGFSMGGRVCLNIVQLFPNLIKHLILLAPDGLQHNFWYNLATRKAIGKRIFRSITIQPKWILHAFDHLHSIHILKESNYKYFKEQFGNRHHRIQLYKVWNVMSELKNDIATTINTLNESSINVQLIVGQHDHIIPVKHVYQFKQKVPKTRLTILKKGHRILNKSILPYLNTSL